MTGISGYDNQHNPDGLCVCGHEKDDHMSICCGGHGACSCSVFQERIPADISPAALIAHAEVAEVIAEGLDAQARATLDPEQQMVVEDCADDCRTFARVFRCIALRDKSHGLSTGSARQGAE